LKKNNLQKFKTEKRLNKKDLELKYDNKILNFITKKVYNPEFWARAVRRFIVDNIEDIIAEKVINNKRKKVFNLVIDWKEMSIK